MEFPVNKDTENKCKFYRIGTHEYQKIGNLLGRPPQGVEWALFSALWSEHCSYKSSKIHLKKFAESLNQTVVNSSGENAGIVDLGQGEQIAFKMESHNHPSFIEPFQGAATGVGGILRDIFTMGAKPIALANYLCFGEITADRMPMLTTQVVKGISHYGNCVGVPTVTGQTEFHKSYNKNILVNAMAVGLLRKGDPITLSGAKGIGNFVVYVGAKTGKDGVHGASMASESFDESSDSKKPNIQIGDPYFEKLLIESCLEVFQQNLVVSIQDMGAAGLTSSSFEMASKGGVGLKINLHDVPMRNSDMMPEEILLSESQERMLLICEPSKFEPLQKVFLKWGLDAVKIGEVQSKKTVDLFWKNELLTSIDPDLLVENAPVYERKFVSWKSENRKDQLAALPKVKLEQYLFSTLEKNIACSRRNIYRQYDQRVGAKTAHGSDYDIAILQLPDSKRGLAVAVGCRPILMRMDAEVGAWDSIFYPSLQMAVKGAKAKASTDCLNFGNPEKVNVMSEFVVTVEAIKNAAIKMQTPVVSGNVSFYNETLGENITSTPGTGLIGLRPDVLNLPEDTFVKEGSSVYLLELEQIKSNVYFSELNNQNDYSWTGKVDLSFLSKWITDMADLSYKIKPLSTQAVGAQGLAITLCKMGINDVGMKLEKKMSQEDLIQTKLYQVIFEIEKNREVEFLDEVQKFKNFQMTKIGVTTKSSFDLDNSVKFLTENVKNAYNQDLRKNTTGM